MEHLESCIESISSDVDLKLGLYLTILRECRKECLKESFRIFYDVYRQDKTYNNIIDFCVDAVGVKKEFVINAIGFQHCLHWVDNTR